MVMVEPRAEPRRVVLVEESTRERILSVGATWMTAQCALIVLGAELHENDGWRGDGAPTCAHWIANALDLELSTAREWLRVGKHSAHCRIPTLRSNPDCRIRRCGP
ncbi:MAG: hypothetical protein ABJC79_16585 [Acidimicrobiia bacterium]